MKYMVYPKFFFVSTLIKYISIINHAILLHALSNVVLQLLFSPSPSFSFSPCMTLFQQLE